MRNAGLTNIYIYIYKRHAANTLLYLNTNDLFSFPFFFFVCARALFSYISFFEMRIHMHHYDLFLYPQSITHISSYRNCQSPSSEPKKQQKDSLTNKKKKKEKRNEKKKRYKRSNKQKQLRIETVATHRPIGNCKGTPVATTRRVHSPYLDFLPLFVYVFFLFSFSHIRTPVCIYLYLYFLLYTVRYKNIYCGCVTFPI